MSDRFTPSRPGLTLAFTKPGESPAFSLCGLDTPATFTGIVLPYLAVIAPMDKRYQVFVSSTFADLQEERQAVMQALLSLDHFPAGMELFPASDEDQWALIKGVIDDSDYYVLVVGGAMGLLQPTASATPRWSSTTPSFARNLFSDLSIKVPISYLQAKQI